MIASPYDKYLEVQVQTAPPENLVLMLYDGAMRFATQAKADLVAGNRESAHSNLIRAQDIMSELMSSLNFDAGDVAENLFKLYEYMNYRLIQANISQSEEPIDEVLKMLAELRGVWSEAIREYRGATARGGGQ